MENRPSDSIIDRIGIELDDAFERADARVAERRAAALKSTERTARWAGFARDPGLTRTLLWRSGALARAAGASEVTREGPDQTLASIKRLAPGETATARVVGHVQSPAGGGEADLIDADGCPIAASPIDALGNYAISAEATGEEARVEIRDAQGQVAVVDGRPITLTPGLLVRRDFTTGRCGKIDPGEEPVVDHLEMPDLIGRSDRAARKILKELGGFQVSFKEKHDTAEADTVIDQAPLAGRRIAVGDAVELLISLGPEDGQDMPNLVDLTEKEARAALADLKFRSVRFVPVLAPDNAGRIVKQAPEPGAPLGTNDDIELCLGVAARLMPDLVGRTRKEALEILVPDLTRAPKIEEVQHSGTPDIVLKQSPNAGEAVGDEVVLVISTGPRDDDEDRPREDDPRRDRRPGRVRQDTVEEGPKMPDVIGLTRAKAVKLLETEGFVAIDYDEVAARKRGARVLEQDPEPGEYAPAGRATLTFGKPG